MKLTEAAGAATRNALALALDQGVRVLPCHQITRGRCSCSKDDCRTPGKHPRVPKGVDDATTDPATLELWSKLWPTTNWGQALDDRIVVDIDVVGDKDGWGTIDALAVKHGTTRDDLLSGEFNTTRVRTGRGGTQLIFSLPPGVAADSVRDKLGAAVDLKRGGGHYVMVPGSATDDEYVLEKDGPTKILPTWVIEEAKKYVSKVKAAETRAAKASGASGAGVSGLLAVDRDAPEKGNEWVTALLGYVVKGLRNEEGLYELGRVVCDAEQADPMSDADLLKVVRSVLRQESRNHPGRGDSDLGGMADPTTGYLQLADDGRSLSILASDGNMDLPHAYLDCGLRVTCVVDDGDSRFYRLAVEGHAHTGVKHLVVPSSRLVDPRKRAEVFAGLGYTFDPPGTATYPMSDGARLLRYLEAQDAPNGQAVSCLGWDRDGFLTASERYSDGQWTTFDRRIPHPDVVATATASYGRETPLEEVREVLREVYTFQDEMVAAVAMSWWAMCMLKGQYRSSIAPILYVDASSGSGKTSGLFAFLVALSGNTSGSGTITVPRIRQQLASNRNGIVWVDDVTNLRGIDEVLRQAASKGTHVKTDTRDNVGTITHHMVGNVLLSCEGVGDLMQEKAMRDRTVHLEVPSVAGRTSLRGDYPQWDDILAMFDRYGATSDSYSPFAEKMAGRCLELLTPHAGLAQPEQYRSGSGRHGEKLAIIRAGARVLGAVLGSEGPRKAVERWCATQDDLGGQNLFTGAVAPRLLREFGNPTDWQGTWRGQDDYIFPVYADPDSATVWVNVPRCSDVWAGLRGVDDRGRQLGSKESISKELADIGVVARQCRKERRNRASGVRVHYVPLPREISAKILGVAEGGHLEI